MQATEWLIRIAGFLLGLVAGTTFVIGFALGYLGTMHFFGQGRTLGTVKGFAWLVAALSAPFVLWWAVVTYLATNWEFRSAGGAGALVAFVVGLFASAWLAERGEAYWDTDRTQVGQQWGGVKKLVDQLAHRFNRPSVLATTDCSIPGLERFLQQLGDVARTEGEEVAWGTLVLKGLEYETPGKAYVAISYEGGGVGYLIPPEHEWGSANLADEPRLRKEVAQELYRLLTEDENVAPGAVMPAEIRAS